MVPAFLLALVAFTPLITADSASAASGQRVTLGKKNLKLEPNCGKGNFSRDCIVEGNVTGYQSKSRTTPGRNFEVPFDGKVVAWSISLSRPTKKHIQIGDQGYDAQMPFFNNLFGSPAQAKISVLRRVEKRKKGPPKYKLVRHSPVQILNPYFGSKVTFALTKPLNVHKGQMIGLTIPTWAPAIWKPAACNRSSYESETCNELERKYTWRGSRGPKYCELGADEDTGEPNAALKKTRPQQKIGSVKRYGCYYGGNVLLYSAIVVGK